MHVHWNGRRGFQIESYDCIHTGECTIDIACFLRRRETRICCKNFRQTHVIQDGESTVVVKDMFPRCF